MPSRIPKSKPSRPSDTPPRQPRETLVGQGPSREAELQTRLDTVQATLDAVVVELDKKSKRVEELEKELAGIKEVAARFVPPPSLKLRADELEAFLRRSIKNGAINYTEAAELLNKK
jgi:hypothetical protein